jgi:hypothetical protein
MADVFKLCSTSLLSMDSLHACLLAKKSQASANVRPNTRPDGSAEMMCLETQTLDRLGERLGQLENTKGEGINYVAKYNQPHHVAH